VAKASAEEVAVLLRGAERGVPTAAEHDLPRRYKFFAGPPQGADASPRLTDELLIYEGSSSLENTGWRLWRGSYTMARHLERCRPHCADWDGLSVLDLSCGVGLCGLALCRVCADVTLTEMPQNVAVVRQNVAANCEAGSALRCRDPVVVPYEWGASLPAALRRHFDLVLCNDLFYEVYRRSLHVEFHSTLRDLVNQRGRGGSWAIEPQMLFCFQVRATPQERRIISELSARLHGRAEELDVGDLPDGFEGLNACDPPLKPKLRLLRIGDSPAAAEPGG